MNLMGEIFKLRAKELPNKECLVDWSRKKGGGGERLTYSDVQDRTYRLVNGLMKQGVSRENKVVIVGWNSNEVFEVILGSAIGGYLYCHINPELNAEELCEAIYEKMKADTIFFDEAYKEKLLSVQHKMKSVKNWISFDGKTDSNGIISFYDLIENSSNEEPSVQIDQDDLHALYCSGGTTGAPKLASWTHETSLITGIEAMTMYGIGREDILGFIGPNFWSIYLSVNFWPAIIAGCKTVVLKGDLNVQDYMKAVEAEKVSFGVIPSFTWLEIMNLPNETIKQYDLSSIHKPSIIGYTFTPEVWRQSKDKLGVIPIQVFGSCESTFSYSTSRDIEVWLNGPEYMQKFVTSQGAPFVSKELRIVNSVGAECAPGELGELISRGGAQAVGYYGQPDKTSKSFIDGWFYTGNMCVWDGYGNYYLKLKKEDLGMLVTTKAGGFISPLDIQEAVLDQMPEVAEVAVIAVPKSEKENVFKVIVYLKKGQHVTIEDVLQACYTVAPDYLVLKDVVFRVDAIPKTASGKVLVRKLQQEYGTMT
jgi:acyl-coenzyme A synthetase/AMP-(fatty) acid ligase